MVTARPAASATKIIPGLDMSLTMDGTREKEVKDMGKVQGIVINIATTTVDLKRVFMIIS